MKYEQNLPVRTDEWAEEEAEELWTDRQTGRH